MVIVVMGVAGSGKTTVGQRLALALDWAFVDADDLHPAENVKQIRAGVPLTDTGRGPWLDALAQLIGDHASRNENLVLACSALRRDYRRTLLSRTSEPGDVRFVHLHVDPETLSERLERRTGHFFPPSLLHSQLGTWEEPGADEAGHVISVDATQSPDDVVADIRRRLLP